MILEHYKNQDERVKMLLPSGFPKHPETGVERQMGSGDLVAYSMASAGWTHLGYCPCDDPDRISSMENAEVGGWMNR